MKKLLTLAAMFTAIALSSCKYDDDDLWSSVHGLEDRVAKLEELCSPRYAERQGGRIHYYIQ